MELFLSFPSSSLGTHLWRQALLGESQLALMLSRLSSKAGALPKNGFPSWSLGTRKKGIIFSINP
jgi:hypothetical protein